MTRSYPRQPTDDVPERAALESSIRRGTRWVIAAQIASQLVSFAVLAALYRLVAPDQFGLLGIVMPLLLLAKIFASFGLNVATVQQRELTDGQLTTIFWANVLLSALVAAAVAAIGPLFVWYYGTAQLGPLVAALAGTLLVAACGAQHQALLERRLELGRLMAARLVAQAAGAVAAVAAGLAQWAVWALVIGQYVELAMLAALVWRLESWRPRHWQHGQAAGALLAFGGFYSLSSLMFFLAQNADKILIALLLGGSRAGQAAVGLYCQAFNVMMKPVYLVSSPMTSIMLPALARVAKEPDELQSLAVRFYRMVAVLLFPAGVGLTVVAPDVMLLLGGSNWRPAGFLLMALSPTILVQGLLNISGSVFAATGHARALFLAALVTAAVLITAVLSGLWVGRLWMPSPEGPTLGVACCYAAATLLVVTGPYLVVCFRVAGIAPQSVLMPLIRPLLDAMLMGLLAWGTLALAHRAGFSLPLRLLLTVIVGAVSYAVLARREIRWFWEQMNQVPA